VAVDRCFGLVSVHFLDWHQFMRSIFATSVTWHSYLHSVALTVSETQYTRTDTCALLDYHYMQSAAASITVQLGHLQ